jgi:hypothetical protein
VGGWTETRPVSLGLLPSGSDPVGEWCVHRQPPSLYLDHAGSFRKLRERKAGRRAETLSIAAGRGDDVARQPSGAVGSQEDRNPRDVYRLSYAPKRGRPRHHLLFEIASKNPKFVDALVSTGPGAIALTLILRAPNSLASTRVIAFTAPFVAE